MGPLTQRHDTPTPGTEPAARVPTSGRRDGNVAEKFQGPRGLNGASTGHSVAVERTSIDDWIDGDEMDLENGEQV